MEYYACSMQTLFTLSRNKVLHWIIRTWFHLFGNHAKEKHTRFQDTSQVNFSKINLYWLWFEELKTKQKTCFLNHFHRTAMQQYFWYLHLLHPLRAQFFQERRRTGSVEQCMHELHHEWFLPIQARRPSLVYELFHKEKELGLTF